MRWIDVERRSEVGADLFLAAVALVLVWTLWSYAFWLWPLAVAGSVLVGAFVVWSIRCRKALGTVLDGDTLVERRQRTEIRVPVTDIAAIEYKWIPYVGGSLFVRGRSGELVELQLGSPELIELGRLLRKRKPMLSFSPRVERELGYYE